MAALKGLENKLNIMNVLRAVLTLTSSKKVVAHLDDKAILAEVENYELLKKI